MTTPSFHLVRTGSPHDDKAKAAALQALHAQPLPPRLTDLAASAPDFQLDVELETAINMALAVGAPLLLTGEPGTGKTQVAWFLGHYFGIPVFPFYVKSSSSAQDLKYDFDAVAYLRWAQHGKDERDRSAFLHKKALWQAYEHATTSVVLVDEIDKAPRDFPNDLLHELNQHSFRHPFDDQVEVKPRASRPPIVVVTSNAERRLPDAFLRRCIFHHFELTEDLVQRIVRARAGSFPTLPDAVRDRALQVFSELRKKDTLSKKPATAELLTWLAILAAQGTRAENLATVSDATPGIRALIKDARDLAQLR